MQNDELNRRIQQVMEQGAYRLPQGTSAQDAMGALGMQGHPAQMHQNHLGSQIRNLIDEIDYGNGSGSGNGA